jgi:hypothetical protein
MHVQSVILYAIDLTSRDHIQSFTHIFILQSLLPRERHLLFSAMGLLVVDRHVLHILLQPELCVGRQILQVHQGLRDVSDKKLGCEERVADNCFLYGKTVGMIKLMMSGQWYAERLCCLEKQ